ncbi:hypothetical protein V6N13_115946 [Hibiscus sabdariffa]
MFSLRWLPWIGAVGLQKVQLSAVELESLRTELADIEEREALLKARLEHIDGILRSARLSGYLYIRTVCIFPIFLSSYSVYPASFFVHAPILFWLMIFLRIFDSWKRTASPREPASIDDTDVEDWHPRFVVLHGQCIFFYLTSADLSPMDSTLLSDVVEVGSLPREEEEGMRYPFYILTRQGLRYECSHASKMQVGTWLSALQVVSKSEVLDPNG